jgi:uncharacterized protein
MAMTIHDLYKGNVTWLPTRTIFLARAGSHAYGLNTETSDIDVRGICVPPRQYFHGFTHRFEQMVQHEPVDLTVFGLVKFCALAAECNPNIIEILWTDESDWLEICRPVGEWLIEARDVFLSQKAKHTFSGYAIAQLKRIRTHRKWLLRPPTHQPTRAEYELPEATVVPADVLGAIESVQASGLDATFPPHVMEIYARERKYQSALREWQQYQEWKRSRNPKRAELEAAHGYDCKHAMHLVRLMRMCREILTTKQVVVKRPDRDELLAIRNGAWEYDQLIEWAEAQDTDLTVLMKASGLPHSPPRERLDAICIRIVEALL